MSILTINYRGIKMELIFNSVVIHLLVFFFGILFSFVIFSMIFFPIYMKFLGIKKRGAK